ncbi:MAG: ComEC/Rec2 family competence protein [Candidatus Paceibacterota bacterium]
MLQLKNKILFLLLGLILLNLLAWTAVFQSPSGFLEVNFFDVGQGDSIFIQTPGRQQILIDGGPNDSVLKKLNKEMPFWDRSIDLLILTHPESDHISGLLEVLDHYEIKYVMWNGIDGNTARYSKWKEALQKEGCQQIIAKEGQELKLTGGTMEVVYPFRNLWNEHYKRSNDVSVVTRLNYGENEFLFAGDISKKIEKQVSEKRVRADVLKVAHHGSKTSSSDELLKAVDPEVGIITVGENDFGHPHFETLFSLEKYGIKVLRTDQDGDIKILSDKNKFKILTH